MKIFCFPHVVLYELMKAFEPPTLILLSFCSKKAYAFVKTFSTTTRDLNIKLSSYNDGYCGFYPNDFLIRVFSKNEDRVDTLDLKTTHGFTYCLDEFGVITCCEDAVQTTNYICYLFKAPVSTVAIMRETDLWLLDFVQRRQEQRLKMVTASHICISAEIYSRVMSCDATVSLYCGMLPSPNYRFDGKLPPVKNLDITHGDWITREHLLGLESSYTQLGAARLSSSDVNALLRSWLNGGLPNLKYLQLNYRIFDAQIYENIHDQLESVQGEIRYKWHEWDHDQSYAKFTTNAFHIRRDDGVVATVMIGEGSVTMAVWPDLNGNRV